MAAEISSEDFVAVCLYLSDFDPNISLTDLADRAERYQKERGFRFLYDEEDFREAFLDLLLRNFEFPSCEDRIKALGSLSLVEVIPLILKYRQLWVNDSDTTWMSSEMFGARGPTKRNAIMRAFFQRSVNDPEEIRQFLVGNRWGEEMLDPARYR